MNRGGHVFLALTFLFFLTQATLLMKQAWPQTSSSCATEGTFHLPVDTGTENRTYQASSAAFSK